MANEYLQSKEFLALGEDDQVRKLLRESVSFRELHKQNPEGAIARLRGATGKPKDEQSAVGEVIREEGSRFHEAVREQLQEHGPQFGEGVRQFGSGMAESVLDVTQLPFEAAEWVASAAGSDWRTGVDEAIEEFTAEQFPAPTTAVGRIARKAGYGVGIGIQTYLTGGLAAGTKLPYLARAGRFITGQQGKKILGKEIAGGLGLEAAAGTAGGVAGGLVDETEAGQKNPWLGIGAAILAGGAAGVAIAARGPLRRAAAREQPPGAAGAADGSSPSLFSKREFKEQGGRAKDYEAYRKRILADQARRDAIENATTDEVKGMLDDMGDPVTGTRTMMAAHKWDVTQQLDSINQSHLVTVLGGELSEKYLAAAVDVASAAGIQRIPGRTLMSQMVDVMESGQLPSDIAEEILSRHGISLEEIGDLFLASGSEAGRQLGMFGQQAKRFYKLSAQYKKKLGRELTEEEQMILRGINGINREGMGFWRRLENIRRGLLVTQMATAMRNFETQAGNLTINALEDSLDAAAKWMFYSSEKQLAHPTNALGPVLRLFGAMNPVKQGKFLVGESTTKKQVDAIADFYAKHGDDVLEPLWARLNGDILLRPAKGPLEGLEKMTLLANSMNRLQESTLRRVFFTSELDRILSSKGQSIAKLEAAGELGKLVRKDVEDAVSYALERTWGKEFSKNAGGAEGVAGALIYAVNHIGKGPLQLTQVLPFPRFMANSIKWQFDHLPFAMRYWLAPKKLFDQVREGDLKGLMQSVSGTAIFMSAYQARSREADLNPDKGSGTKWYELTLPEDVANALNMEPGSKLDTRAYNPFAAHMFLADLAHRGLNDNWQGLTGRDIAMGIASSNLRAGAGMYIMDKFLDEMGSAFASTANYVSGGEEIDAGTTQSFIEALSGNVADYTGTAWSGMLVPFQQLKDVVAHFDETQRIVRNAEASPGVGQFQTKLPYVGDNLPPVELATREAPPETLAPLTRQMTGLTLRGPSNPVETELTRLGFTRGNILPSTGDEQWDQLRAKHMGPIVENEIAQAVAGEQYQTADEETKAILMEKYMAAARKHATQRAAREDPKRYRASIEGRRSKRMQAWRATLPQRILERQKRMEGQR